jgi:hypothetical protein
MERYSRPFFFEKMNKKLFGLTGQPPNHPCARRYPDRTRPAARCIPENNATRQSVPKTQN